MRFVKAAEIRAAEQRAIQSNPARAADMMARAGAGLARTIRFIGQTRSGMDRRVRLIAGPGNNGGDILAAAWELAEFRWQPEVWLACSVARLQGVAKDFFDRLSDRKIHWREMAREADWIELAPDALMPPILVDGLLGTGAAGAPAGVIRRAIEYINAASSYSLIVAADLPSGMDAETGAAAGEMVRADFTVTMGYPKIGMSWPASLTGLGSLRCVAIGLPRDVATTMADARPGVQWISETDVRELLPRRPATVHKGVLGWVHLVGGSAEYPGAMVLAAEGATRSGVGGVQVMTVPASAAAIAARMPEVIVRDHYSADWDIPADASAVVVGPGLGRDPEARRLVARLLRETPVPLVLDADAIGLLAGRPEVVRSCPQPVVMTPHPGELAELMGVDVAEIKQDRLGHAVQAAEQTGAVVVLKGAGTWVVQAGQPAWLNLTGNPGLACGGSGDVLAGLLGGLLAQGIPADQAARAAVWLHGVAGDIAALRLTQAAMNASDLAAALPTAFRQVTAR